MKVLDKRLQTGIPSLAICSMHSRFAGDIDLGRASLLEEIVIEDSPGVVAIDKTV